MNQRLISGTDSLFLAQAEDAETADANPTPRSPAHRAYRSRTAYPSRTALAREGAGPAREATTITPQRRALIDGLMQARQAILEKIDPVLREKLRAAVEGVIERQGPSAPPAPGPPGEPTPNTAAADGDANAPARDGRDPGTD